MEDSILNATFDPFNVSSKEFILPLIFKELLNPFKLWRKFLKGFFIYGYVSPWLFIFLCVLFLTVNDRCLFIDLAYRL